jgi:tetratricopeptide (TPR) repeat protein
MPKTLSIIALLFCLTAALCAQKLEKPTLTPVPPTPAQQKTLQEGVALHDLGKYDEAIAKYESILLENHDCTAAMYEMSMTLYANGSKEKAAELSNIGSKYISDELPLFYVTMANVLDDYGKPQAAIKIYQEGLKLLDGDTRFRNYRGSLFYNLGVTYLTQKNYDQARSALKSAVENDYSYASPHYLLSVVFSGSHYKIPALLAASRFISLEFNTERSLKSAAIVADVLKAAPKDPKTGNNVLLLDSGTATDEGDFAGANLFLGTLTLHLTEKDKNKTEDEMFVQGIETLIALLAEDKKLASSFVGRNYVPFMVDMKKRGHIDAFSHVVLYLSGKKDALAWLKKNDAKLEEFRSWAKAYRLP